MLHTVRVNPAAHRFFVSNACHPQTLDVLRTRSAPQGIEVVIDDAREFNPTRPTSARCCNTGHRRRHSRLYEIHPNGPPGRGKVAMATDLLR